MTNNVRGPTSALTEFLRELGINHALIQRRGQRWQQQQAEAGPSNASTNANQDITNEEEQGGLPDSLTGEAAPDSDHLDSEEEVTTGKKRKLSKAALERQKASAKKKAKKNDDEDYKDNEEDAYTAKSLRENKSTNPKPSIGSLQKCSRCSKQFTMTKYTMAANPPPGYLCHSCAKSSGADPFKKPAAPRKRKSAAEKRTITNFQERKLPTLVFLCIKVISQHINDVEAFGDIGSVNLDRIVRALCRNRSLTPENATLFYDVRNKNINIYDGTRLEPPALTTLALLNPNLTSLRIDFCGHLNNAVLDSWSTSLPALTRVELLGPFLVRVPAWISFFRSHPGLKGFLLHQSPRFDLECMSALVTHCSRITELRLKEIGKLDDTFLPHISSLKYLEQLDLSSPGASCSDDSVISVLKERGAQLTHLDLSCHNELGDDFLKRGILAYTPHLVSLKLDNLPSLTDEGVAAFFHAWTPSVLSTLSIARAHDVGSHALPALLDCAWSTLSTLNINAWRDTTVESLVNIAKAQELRTLDIGWNRAVDNFVIKAILDGCPKLEEIKCWGCNRVTAECPRKLNVNLHGVESSVYVDAY
ncbi:RNI-like protein [Multifurca ochricompacta]|uniref:RNI-like protein n=1 Tax=Multifurca ochricompacta TaxID=376703 RepID=A0AAD4QN88_9AGAM|nr:RNI-like protein [Multifurca ochricompacta]